MKILGLDVGSKTIGVAVSDELGITAQGVTTLKRKGLNHDIMQLLKMIEEQKAGKVVVGLPKNMNGSLGKQAQKAISFAEKLKLSFRLSVELEDERLSTSKAEKFLIETNRSRKKRKKVIDKMSAVIILQSFLDRRMMSKEIKNELYS